MTPTQNANEYPVQKTVFDLDSFEEVTLAKSYTFAPVADVQSALARLGNDSAKLITVINDGLRAEAQRMARNEDTGWMEVDEETGVKSAFSGTLANLKVVNACVLNLAKTVFGFSKDLDKAGKTAAKDKAREFVKTNPTIREGLKKSAATPDVE